ncbi:hypothetical protein [Neptuniibacter pectenicola]|uniref:hypothetical protein n=2 Tax=Neptuniibacter pectenicola TaxID=1806669 RepID=UPI000ADB8A3F|nr:hypothetical protein [Neptuniibacter pectenicola]
MMFKRNLVSVSIASILLVAPLVASANTGSSDDEDSVQSWGQWAQNFATAAGGEVNTAALGLAFAGVGQGETGRNGQNEPGFGVPVDPLDPGAADIALCEAGAICGFVTIRESNYSQSSAPASQSEQSRLPVPTRFAVVDVGTFTAEVHEVDTDRPNWRRVLFPHIGGSFTVQGNEGYELTVEDAIGTFGYGWGGLAKQEGSTYSRAFFDNVFPLLGVAEGTWSDSTLSRSGFDNANGAVWAGITTSLDQLNDYTGSNGVIASYSGITMHGGTFAASIDFGNNTWNGAWNNGDVQGDGFVRTTATNVVGQVAFAVTNGTVDGINFMANSGNLSAVDGVVTGSVNGAIFGGNAQSVVGMVDIVKSTNEYTDLQHETLFAGVNDAITSPVPR